MLAININLLANVLSATKLHLWASLPTGGHRYPRFIDEGTEAQSSKSNCSRSHGKKEAELGSRCQMSSNVCIFLRPKASTTPSAHS